jgi:hypothetical protein
MLITEHRRDEVSCKEDCENVSERNSRTICSVPTLR